MLQMKLQILWLSSLLTELKITQTITPILYCDNQAAISVAKSCYIGSNLKHVAIRWHHIKNLITTNQIDIKYIQTELQLADILTKPLSVKLFVINRDKLIKSISQNK